LTICFSFSAFVVADISKASSSLYRDGSSISAGRSIFRNRVIRKTRNAQNSSQKKKKEECCYVFKYRRNYRAYNFYDRNY